MHNLLTFDPYCLFSVSDTYRGDRGFNGCIYSIQIDDIDVFERVVQEPRPSDIQLVPNAGRYIHTLL